MSSDINYRTNLVVGPGKQSKIFYSTGFSCLKVDVPCMALDIGHLHTTKLGGVMVSKQLNLMSHSIKFQLPYGENFD